MKKFTYISAGLLTLLLFLGFIAMQAGLLSSGAGHIPYPPPPPAAGPPDEVPDSDDFLAADKALDKLEIANIAFNAPQKMNAEESTMIQLFLGISKSSEELSKEITAPGTKESASIRVSKYMEAQLTGANFSITAVTPEKQMISRNSITDWKWEVQPKSEGRLKLHLMLTAIIDVNGTSVQKAIRTFDREIEVEITIRQALSHFVKENWQWLWAAILIPLFGWGIKIFRTKTAQNPPG